MGEFERRIVYLSEKSKGLIASFHIKDMIDEARKEFPCGKLDLCRRNEKGERTYCHQCEEPEKWFGKWLAKESGKV